MQNEESESFHYVYKITNLINNHFYYGVHNTHNLNDGYMGSGKLLHKAYIKYGVENFKKEIIKFFDTPYEAFSYESHIVNETIVKNPNCYNLINGGIVGTTNMVVVKDSSNNISTVYKNDPRYISGELVPWCKGVKREYMRNKFIGKDMNGNTLISSIDDPRYISGDIVGIANGNVLVKDTEEHYYMVSKYDPRYINGELIHAWKNKHHNESSIQKMRATHLKNEHQRGNRNSQYGKCWITRNGINKSIHKSELQEYLIDGWVVGRTLRLQNDKISSIDKDRVMKLREEGKTWTSIAKELNISENGIYKYKKRNNL